jgi:fructose-bisphosphate aldolase class I
MHTDGTMEQRLKRSGFVAALDQSGGSTPSALLHYGIAASEYAGEEECSASCTRCACAS